MSAASPAASATAILADLRYRRMEALALYYRTRLERPADAAAAHARLCEIAIAIAKKKAETSARTAEKAAATLFKAEMLREERVTRMEAAIYEGGEWMGRLVAQRGQTSNPAVKEASWTLWEKKRAKVEGIVKRLADYKASADAEIKRCRRNAERATERAAAVSRWAGYMIADASRPYPAAPGEGPRHQLLLATIEAEANFARATALRAARAAFKEADKEYRAAAKAAKATAKEAKAAAKGTKGKKA
jgi:hypothetical protein